MIYILPDALPDRGVREPWNWKFNILEEEKDTVGLHRIRGQRLFISIFIALMSKVWNDHPRVMI